MYTITVMVIATEIMNLLTTDYVGHLLVTCMASVLVDSRSKGMEVNHYCHIFSYRYVAS